MNRKYSITLLFMLVAGSMAYAQHSGGYVYALPQNTLKVKVNVAKTIYHKGPFAEFAEEVTGLSMPVIEENEVKYGISQVQLQVQHMPDTLQVYPIDVSHVMFSQLANKGMILNMGVPAKDYEAVHYDFEAKADEYHNKFYMYKASDMMLKYDTAYVEVMVDSMPVKQAEITSYWVAKPSRQMASEAAEKIESIRSDYYDLISGYHESDYTDLKLMLQELKGQENDLMVLFTGYRQPEYTTYEYTFTFPMEAKADEFDADLLVVSVTDGVIPHCMHQPGQYKYSLHFARVNTMEAAYAGKVKNAFHYRKPAYYKVWLMENGTARQYMGVIPIAQYGSVMQMDSKVMQADMNAATGELENISIQVNHGK